MKYILASASPRRHKLLKKVVPEFNIQPADINEVINPNESVVDNIRRLAAEKARAIPTDDETVVIGADTVVVWHDEIIGKPRGKEDAQIILTQLSEDTHEVITAWCVRRGDREIVHHDVARVTFRPLPFGELEAYLAMNDPTQYAGGYAIQGAGRDFVEEVEGNEETVIGLPTTLVAADIEEIQKEN